MLTIVLLTFCVSGQAIRLVQYQMENPKDGYHPTLGINPSAEEAQALLAIDKLDGLKQGRCKNGGEEQIEEWTFCNKLHESELANECLIYNFGVGTQDTFLQTIGSKYKGCQVFAFDPTVPENIWNVQGGVQKVFGPNVTFRSWGLFGGEGPRTSTWNHPVYGEVKGKLFTLSEIQEMLGHLGKRITLFRSDCEGCEWGWISTQMKENPAVFEHIDQILTEFHFASTLRFDEKAMHRSPVVAKMIRDNFDVLRHNVNPGFEWDQNQVPSEVVQLGISSQPCCREMTLIAKYL